MPSSIYNEGFYDSNTLHMWAKFMLDELPPETTVLVSSGASGCAIASAMLTLSKKTLQHYHLRKDGEVAHWEARAGYEPDRNDYCVIVDDLVASGKTLTHIAKKSEVEPKLALIAQDFSHRYPPFKVPFGIKYLEKGGYDEPGYTPQGSTQPRDGC